MVFESTYGRLLGACQDIEQGRERLAKPILESCLQPQVTLELPPEQLIGHIFADALLRRIDRQMVESKNIYIQKFDISQIDLFYNMVRGYPIPPAAHHVANEYLRHELRRMTVGGLLDIGIGKGLQVGQLVERLSGDPGRLRHLNVIAVDPDEGSLQDARAHIESLAKELAFTVAYHPFCILIEESGPEVYSRIRETAGGDLLINSAFAMHHTAHRPHDTEFRTVLLRRLNDELHPRLFTLIEPNANHDTEHLARRFEACWEHFGTTFHLVDESQISPEQSFVIKVEFFGREIRDIMGTGDAFRNERHEPYDSWLSRLAEAGLEPYPEAVDFDLPLPSHCSFLPGRGLIRLCYRHQPMVAVFAYRYAGMSGTRPKTPPAAAPVDPLESH